MKCYLCEKNVICAKKMLFTFYPPKKKVIYAKKMLCVTHYQLLSHLKCYVSHSKFYVKPW